MAAGLGWVLLAVLGYFGVFIVAVGYAQWTTRGMAPAARRATPAE